MMLRKRHGFTLIELLVVMIIIGILAAVSIPMLTANIDKAKKTEAITAMGTIRTALKAYNVAHNVNTTSMSELYTEGFLSAAGLDGTYFSNVDYSIFNIGATIDYIRCDGNSTNSVAIKRSEVNGTSFDNIRLYWNGLTANY